MHRFSAAGEYRGQLVNILPVANDEVSRLRDRDGASVAEDYFDDIDRAVLDIAIDDAVDDDENETPDCDDWMPGQLAALECCGDDVSTPLDGEDVDDGGAVRDFGDGLSQMAIDWDSSDAADSRGMVDEVGGMCSDARLDALWDAQATSALLEGEGENERDDWMSDAGDVVDEYDESEARLIEDEDGPLDGDRSDLGDCLPTHLDASEDDTFGPQETSNRLWEIEQDAPASLEVPSADQCDGRVLSGIVDDGC